MPDEDVSAGAPPPPTAEYLAQSQQATIRGVTWMSVSVPLAIVICRVYTRTFLRKVFGLDDGFIVLAMALLISYGGVIEAAVTKGLGRHVEYVMMEMPQNAIPIALLGQVSQPLVIMSCAMGKTSFIVTLLRIGSKGYIKYVLLFILVSMNLLHILVSILLFLRCQDPRVLWDTSIKTTCWPVQIYLRIMYFIGSYSAATDFVLAIMPWVMIWNLNMKKKEKAGVALAMSLGIFAGATAIVKTTFLPANSTSTDPTYDVGQLLLWAGAENALIIFAACLPTLRPLLRAIFPTTVRSSENSHPLKNISNNIFNSRSKQGQWSAIVETEVHPDGASDHNSDRTILRQSNTDPSSSAEQGAIASAAHNRSSASRPGYIKKTTEVDISYDHSDSKFER